MVKTTKAKPETKPAAPKDWTKVFEIHPYAEKYGMPYTDAQIDALGDDIVENKLKNPMRLWKDKAGKVWLMAGCNRLKAVLKKGISIFGPKGKLRMEFFEWLPPDTDPLTFVISDNIMRQHMTTEQKKAYAAELLKQNPKLPNLRIAKFLRLDDKTVDKVRDDLVSRSEIPNVETRADSAGREQPARRPERKAAQQESFDSPEEAHSKRPPATAEQAQVQIAKADADRAKFESKKAEAEAVARMWPPAVATIPREERELLIRALQALASEDDAKRAEAAVDVEAQRARLKMTWAELIVPAAAESTVPAEPSVQQAEQVA